MLLHVDEEQLVGGGSHVSDDVGVRETEIASFGVLRAIYAFRGHFATLVRDTHLVALARAGVEVADVLSCERLEADKGGLNDIGAVVVDVLRRHAGLSGHQQTPWRVRVAFVTFDC